MPIFNTNYLSDQGIRTSGPVPGINAPVLSNQLGAAASQIANAGKQTPSLVNPVLLEPFIDRVGPTVDARKVADIGQVFMQQAIKTADLTNEMLAREKLISIKDELRNLGYDPKTGFFTKRGAEAIISRKEYTDRAERIVIDGFNSVAPGVRSKLMPPLMVEREQFLDNMSQYSVGQRKVWEDDLRESEIADFMRTMPEFVVDPTKSEISKQTFTQRMFPRPPKGIPDSKSKERQDLYNNLTKEELQVVARGSGVFAAAERYFNLADKLTIDARNDIRDWLEAEVKSQNTAVNQEAIRKEREDRLRRDSNYRDLFAAVSEGKRISQGALGEIVGIDQLDVSQAQAITRYQEQIDEGKTDISTYRDIKERLLNSVEADYFDDQGNVMSHIINGDISQTDQKRLIDFAATLKKSNDRFLIKQSYEELDTHFTAPRWTKLITTRGAALRAFYAKEEWYQRAVVGDENSNKVLADIIGAADPETQLYSMLPMLRFRDGTRGELDFKSGDMIRNHLEWLSSGSLPYEEEAVERKKLHQWLVYAETQEKTQEKTLEKDTTSAPPPPPPKPIEGFDLNAIIGDLLKNAVKDTGTQDPDDSKKRTGAIGVQP